MVDQYPDTISFSAATPAVLDPATGNWIPGDPGATVETKCRYEPNGGRGQVVTADGSRVDYSGIAYLPLHSPAIKEGTEVTVTIKRTGETDTVLKEKVLRFSRGQFNGRCWL